MALSVTELRDLRAELVALRTSGFNPEVVGLLYKSTVSDDPATFNAREWELMTAPCYHFAPLDVHIASEKLDREQQESPLQLKRGNNLYGKAVARTLRRTSFYIDERFYFDEESELGGETQIHRYMHFCPEGDSAERLPQYEKLGKRLGVLVHPIYQDWRTWPQVWGSLIDRPEFTMPDTQRGWTDFVFHLAITQGDSLPLGGKFYRNRCIDELAPYDPHGRWLNLPDEQQWPSHWGQRPPFEPRKCFERLPADQQRPFDWNDPDPPFLWEFRLPLFTTASIHAIDWLKKQVTPQPVPVAEEPRAEKVPTKASRASIAELVMGAGRQDFKELVCKADRIIDGPGTVNDKLTELAASLPISIEKLTCQQLAELLGVKRQAVQKSAWWQARRQDRERQKAGRIERHGNRRATDDGDR